MVSWKRLTVTGLSVATLGLAAGTARADAGGPDNFGYIYLDGGEATVNANFVDLTGLGTATDILGNGFTGVQNGEGTYAFPAGVTFSLYGETVSQISVSTDGYISTDGGAPDLPRTCPYPNGDLNDVGPRIYASHEDGVMSLYGQTFLTGTEPAGFSDPVGVTIIQWFGLPNDGGFVSTEAVLFHSTGIVEIHSGTNSGPGTGAGTGLQNRAGDDSITYSCENLASGGVVQFRPGGVPDVRYNEVRIDQSGADNDEYVELVGPPDASLDGIRFFVAGDGAGGSGTIEEVTDLTGFNLDANGLFVVGEATMTIGTPDLVTSLSFENSDNVTFFLAFGAEIAVNDDIDADNDGAIDDAVTWDLELDRVALVEEANPPAGTEFHYGPDECTAGETCQAVGPDGTFVPGHVFRCDDAVGDFLIGGIDATASFDSPGEPNPCECGDGIVIPSEDCDDMGESATCDDDCTAAVCGDGTINVTAAEECDDTGESATCDLDCTDAMCGDNTVNMTAGEDCDDGMESAACNADCTTATCGDEVVNMTAGEDCDDGMESATCNADCTTATCGDGITNTMAGETCDDMGRSATCNANCTLASCGDMVVNATAGEECDDGGMQTATCDADCTNAVCGDMVVNMLAGEECDDGNNDDGDGCAADCTEEAGTTTTGDDTSTGGDDTSTGGGDTSTGGVESSSSSGDSADSSSSDGGLDDSSSSGDASTGTGSSSTTGVSTVSTSTTGDDTGGDEDDGDTDTDGAGAADDSGCGCSTDNDTPPGWALFGVFGLLGLRRRRKSA